MVIKYENLIILSDRLVHPILRAAIEHNPSSYSEKQATWFDRVKVSSSVENLSRPVWIANRKF
jgi:hypothetical protein